MKRIRLQSRRGGLTRLLLTLATTVFAAACGDGDTGPGVVRMEVVPPASVDAGGAVVELTGPGILGVEPLGDVRVYGVPHPAGGDRWRVVVVGGASGPLLFGVRLEDSGRRPQGAVVEAVDRANRSVPGITAFQLRAAR